jgi:hypothetical protein
MAMVFLQHTDRLQLVLTTPFTTFDKSWDWDDHPMMTNDGLNHGNAPACAHIEQLPDINFPCWQAKPEWQRMEYLSCAQGS